MTILPTFAKAIIGLIFIGVSLQASAIVIIEPLEFETEVKWTKEVEASFQKNDGNTIKTRWGAGFEFARLGTEWIFSTALSVEQGDSRGVRDVNKKFSHTRGIYKFNPFTSFEGFYQESSDEFTKLNRRTLIGMGSRLRLYKSEETKMFFGVGVFAESEDIVDQEELNSSSRGNLYFSMVTKRETLKYGLTSYLQPDLAHPEDYRSLTLAKIEFPVSEMVSLGWGIEYKHDNEPPAGVKTWDYSTKFNLGLTF
jgi:putative salt-induced outer membrane protein YdiY